MRNHLTRWTAAMQTLRMTAALLICSALLLAAGAPAAAQKDKKKKKDQPVDTSSMIPMSDEQQIDYLISEMMGAWQVGDVEKLHKDYADDVSFVSGTWSPPVIGWQSYLAVYQQQRARMQQVRLDRYNSYVKVSGAVGWACYQWEFAGTVDGQPSPALGQTTLVLEKRNNHWVIVHNHTSLVQGTPPATPVGTPSPSPQPAKPGGR
jgi:ketosteroid isomerase-like protein